MDTKRSSGAKDNTSEEFKEKDPLAFSKEEAVSGVEEKNTTSTRTDRDEDDTKNKASSNIQKKDPKSDEDENDLLDKTEKENAPSTTKRSSASEERAKSLLKVSESPSGPKDLLYLFQKYSEEEESTNSTDKVTSKLLKKWLEQAKLFDKETGITEEYTTNLFEKSASEKDAIDFEEFQTFLNSMAEEKNQSYSELTHKILSAGKPHMESSQEKDLHEAIEASMEKICSSKFSKEQFKEESEPESSKRGEK